MKLFKVFISFFIILGLFFLIALVFFPGRYKFEQHVEINKPVHEVFGYMRDLKNWEQWSAWNKSVDHSLRYFYSPKSDSLGARQHFNGDLLGTGTFVISSYRENEVIGYKLKMHGGEVNANGTFIFTPRDNGTTLTWVDSGDVGRNPVFRYMIPSKKKSTEEAFLQGLMKIKENLEK